MATAESITVRLDALSSEIALLALDGQGTQEMWLANVALTAAICFLKLTWVKDELLRLEYKDIRDENLEILEDYARKLGL